MSVGVVKPAAARTRAYTPLTWGEGWRLEAWTKVDERHWRREGGPYDPACTICHDRVHPDFLPMDTVWFDNGMIVAACSTCWLRWPSSHKRRADDPDRFPAEPGLSDGDFRKLARLPVAELKELFRT